MSYRYPHADDSDENGFGESLQAPEASTSQPRAASDGSEGDVFEDSETHNNLETTEDDDDEDDEDGDYEDVEDEEDEFHGLYTNRAASTSTDHADPTHRCRARLHHT